MLESLPYTLLTIFGIGLVIFIHELGHFLAARAVGIRVEAFSIGFGKRLFGFRRGDTDYKICLIPLGGYVKMAGEDMTRPTTNSPDEFASKSAWQRAIVITAGVIMNIIFALVAIPIAFAVGIPFHSPLMKVEPGLPAWEAGIRNGDRVLSINGDPVMTIEDVHTEAALATGPIDVEIERGNERFSLKVSPKDEGLGFRTLGIGPYYRDAKIAPDEFELEGKTGVALKRAEAIREAGLSPDDLIVAVNGAPLVEQELLIAAGASNGPIKLRFLRNGQAKDVSLPPQPYRPDEKEDWAIGINELRDRIASVRSVGPASRAGFRVDDRIVAVNGRALGGAESFDLLVGEGVEPQRVEDEERTYTSRMVTIESKRDGKPLVVNLELPTRQERADFLRSLSFKAATSIHISVFPNGPAERAGLRTGDQIRAADGKTIGSFAELASAIRSSEGQRVEFDVLRGDAAIKIQVTPERPLRNGNLPHFVLEAPMDYVKLGFADALSTGLVYTGRKIKQTGLTLRRVTTGNIAPKHLGGIITIFTVSKRYSEIAITRGLLFLAFVSINLAILNLLPIPILDGGLLFFLIIEKIKGSPVNERIAGYFQWAGFIAVIGLMLYVTWNDISRLFNWM